MGSDVPVVTALTVGSMAEWTAELVLGSSIVSVVEPLAATPMVK